VKAILHTAKQNGVKSLAIPSLGVGNPHYPSQLSAKILFEEVNAFHAQNPGASMKCHFVIFEQSVYQEFSKEYAQIKSNTFPQTRVS
jgi:O-acetyl-ADP-ribose deacetylase (regulator of RNase III)